jgi:hypothetical protein
LKNNVAENHLVHELTEIDTDDADADAINAAVEKTVASSADLMSW